jgi:hypothetical protein
MDNKILNYLSNIVSFGVYDIRRAIEVAEAVGEDEDFAAECVIEFSESTGMSISDIDPVYCVYNTILQEVRTEIEKLTGVDFMNDFESYCDVYGNYLDSSFNSSNEFTEELKTLLLENNITEEQLSDKGKFFLEELEIELKEE